MGNIIHFLFTLPCHYSLLAGLILWLLMDRRQSRRRGLGGLQHFDGYFTGLITLLLERLLKWAAVLLVLRGLWGWLFR